MQENRASMEEWSFITQERKKTDSTGKSESHATYGLVGPQAKGKKVKPQWRKQKNSQNTEQEIEGSQS